MSMAIRMADATLAREQEYDYHWCYERGIITKAWCDVSEVTGDKKYFKAARQNVDRYVKPDGSIDTYEMDKYNLDMICMGRTALRMYQKTGETKYKKALSHLIEQLKGQPRTREGGFWHKAIYPQQMWLDGIYMACPFMVEYALCFDAPEWIAEAARQMLLIAEKTYDEKSGLFLHAWDSAAAQPWANQETGCSPHAWGRAMGWFAMAHADVLSVLPEESPHFAPLKAQFGRIVAAIEKARADDLLWHQVLDCPANEENYVEASCSSMFCYTLARGARLGLCDARYGAMARESFDALCERCVRVWEDGYPQLCSICKVAGLGGQEGRDGSYAYYIGETVCAGDTKGTAPFLMAAAELERA